MEHARVASTAVVLVDNLVVNWAEATAETKAAPWVAKTAVAMVEHSVEYLVVPMDRKWAVMKAALWVVCWAVQTVAVWAA